ncbi:T9SS type A sorting domain-containing protein [Flavobacterium capsici]|nr:T9SS type A sorting domain-containing protein [Flavobacterium sp. PMR2A8]WNM17896.1 T9SS type A sorting domain-containing protein [Flavobacterium sp. PMR2A8]
MDKCYQTSTVTRAFTITPAPQVTVNAPAASSTSACAYADQAAVNAAFATWLGGFTVSGGCNPQGSYGEVSAPNACGGTTTVTYTVMDKCYQTSTVTRAFTITPAPQVTVNAPAASSTSACAYADQAAVNAAFATWLGGFTVSGGCNPQGSYGEVSAPNACGGTTTVTYTVMDKCYQTSTVTRAFTITPAPQVTVNAPAASSTSACAYADQAAVNAAFATWLGGFTVSGGCNPQGSYGEVSAPNACGGTTTVTYTVMDKCYQTSTVTRAFTITPAPQVTVNAPAASSTSACAYADQAAVNAAFATWLGGFTVSGGCNPQGSYGEVSAPNACGGTTTVTYTVMDKCYQTSTVTRAFTITPAPQVTVNAPAASSTSACAYADQAAVNAAFATWLGGFTVSGGCNPQGSYGEVSAPNACGGTTTVTYTVMDKCYQTSTVTRAFTITPAPQVTVNAPAASSTSACAYADQAAVNAAFATWLGGFTVSGGCNPQGSYGEVSAPNACGGTTTVTYTVMDKCYQTSTVTRAFTITPAPQVTVNAPAASSTSACAYADQAAVNAAFATWLGGFTVSGGCNPQGSYGEVSAPNACGGTTTVTYTVMDKCYQTSTVTRAFTITPAPVLVLNSPDSTIISSCDYADQAAVDAAFATWLSQFGVTGGCDPKGNYGEPLAPQLCTGGTTTVTFVVTDTCNTADVTETFTVVPAETLTVTCPAYRFVKCGENPSIAFEEWKNGFSYSGGCVNVTVTDLTQYQIPEPGTELVITYTVSDNCQSASCTARFIIEVCGTEGCTLGYWKNHTNRWCSSYTTCDLFGAVFTSAPANLSNLTLLQALNLGGGGIYNLARQGVAALLNACSDDVDYIGYQDNVQSIIDAVNQAYATGGSAPGILGSELDTFNNAGCPLGGTRATTAPNCNSSVAPNLFTSLNRIGVKVYPNPYTDNFNINVSTTNNSKVSVSIYDMIGRLIETIEINPTESNEIKVGDKYPSGVYNVIVSQGVEVKTLRVIKR